MTSNLKKVLSEDIRSKCPDMAEPVYEFTDYVAAHIGDESIEPMGLVLTIVCALDDVDKGRCGFCVGDHSFPQELVEHQFEVKMQAKYILQIIDVVCDADFAEETRALCKDALGWDTPKRTNLGEMEDDIEDKDHPANIVAAVNWWRKTLVSPKMDNGNSQMGLFMALLGSAVNSGNIKEAINGFCAELTKLLCEKFAAGTESVSLNVDYGPDWLLAEAAEKAGARLQFPCKTHMWVKKDEVTVSYGYRAPYEEIWHE